MQKTRIESLDQEDPLEKEMATHSSISCLENSMDRGAWRAIVHGVAELDTGTRSALLHLWEISPIVIICP